MDCEQECNLHHARRQFVDDFDEVSSPLHPPHRQQALYRKTKLPHEYSPCSFSKNNNRQISLLPGSPPPRVFVMSSGVSSKPSISAMARPQHQDSASYSCTTTNTATFSSICKDEIRLASPIDVWEPPTPLVKSDSSELVTLQAIFGDRWSDNDLMAVLDHESGDVNRACERILNHGPLDPKLLMDRLQHTS